MPISDYLEESMRDLSGQVVLGRYRVVRPLARGGMGVVYLGRIEGAQGFSKPVVVKSMLPACGGAQDRERLFAREARILANLQHPGIVAVMDFGRHDANQVMVIEYVHGYNLGQWFRFLGAVGREIPVPFGIHILLSVLEALCFAHGLTRPDGSSLGIIHRDLSPGNILLDVKGQIKLTDFGIARMADDEFKTQEGLFRGTLAFCAPEAIAGSRPTAKLDQYGAAAVAYMLLAGRNPFKGDDGQTLQRVLSHVPPALSTVRPELPAAIDAAIARALSKDPEQRFASVAEFASAIRAGITWSERDVAAQFARQLGEDLGGEELPELLRVEALNERDAAWREAQATPRVLSLRSAPPGGTRTDLDTSRAKVRGEDETLIGSPPVAQKKPALATRLSWLALAALAAGAGAAAVITTLPRATGNQARLVVVEKERGPEADAELPPASAVTTADAPIADPSVAVPGGKASASPARYAAPAPSSAGNRGALLARALQAQESKIESCFQRHPKDLEGAPRISVRFHVDTSGAVQNAALNPSSLAATPLGACLVGVARTTDFGPQPEPISFAIPIAARMVRNR